MNWFKLIMIRNINIIIKKTSPVKRRSGSYDLARHVRRSFGEVKRSLGKWPPGKENKGGSMGTTAPRYDRAISQQYVEEVDETVG